MNKRSALSTVSRPALAVCILMLAGLVATALSTADLSGRNNTGLTYTITQSVKQSQAVAVKKAFAAALPDLAGTWGSNIGLTYTITQSGTQYTWTDNNGATGTISLAASGLTTDWTDAGGAHSATGVIAESDAAGRPMKIAWSNGVVFLRQAEQVALSQGVRDKRVFTTIQATKEALVKSPGVAALPDLAGIWGSNIGLTYSITQSGAQCTWTDNNGAMGIITPAASGLTTNWTDGGGPHSSSGVITESDATGRPATISWSNGVVFQRPSGMGAALTPIQLPAPQTQSLQILTPPPPTVSGLLQSQLAAYGGAFKAFLKIKTIQGDSSDPQHRNEIELTTFGWGGRNAIDVTSPGLGSSGRVEIQPFTFTMPVNSASPYLFLACARGEHIPGAILTVQNSAGREYLILELDDVAVTSYKTAADTSQDVAPIDEVAIGFGRIKMTFIKFKIDGSMEGQFRIGWDLTRNTIF
jgi:type VI secretion system secreted protein Hcp